MDNKICKSCGLTKNVGDFYKVDSKCKECRKSLVIEYRRKNEEKVREYDRARGKLKHRKARTQANTSLRRKDPDGYLSAHNAVARALRSGILEKMPCLMCGCEKLVHAHHDDYSKPLEVMWLCVVHHKARHAYLTYIKSDIF